MGRVYEEAVAVISWLEAAPGCSLAIRTAEATAKWTRQIAQPHSDTEPMLGS